MRLLLALIYSFSAFAGINCDILVNETSYGTYRRVEMGPMLSKPFKLKRISAGVERADRHRVSLGCNGSDEGQELTSCSITVQNLDEVIRVGEMGVTKQVAAFGFSAAAPESTFTFGDTRASEDVLQVTCKNQ